MITEIDFIQHFFCFWTWNFNLVFHSTKYLSYQILSIVAIKFSRNQNFMTAMEIKEISKWTLRRPVNISPYDVSDNVSVEITLFDFQIDKALFKSALCPVETWERIENKITLFKMCALEMYFFSSIHRSDFFQYIYRYDVTQIHLTVLKILPVYASIVNFDGLLRHRKFSIHIHDSNRFFCVEIWRNQSLNFNCCNRFLHWEDLFNVIVASDECFQWKNHSIITVICGVIFYVHYFNNLYEDKRLKQ